MAYFDVFLAPCARPYCVDAGSPALDVRWGLLLGASDDDSMGDAKWSWLAEMGNASAASTAQFLVATDGGDAVRANVGTALRAAGGGIGGYVPVGTFAAVGGPAAAAAVGPARCCPPSPRPFINTRCEHSILE
jgi:hypothetical protein